MDKKENITDWISAFMLFLVSVGTFFGISAIIITIIAIFVGLGKITMHIFENFGLYIIGFFFIVLPIGNWIYGLFKKESK